jgi:hypothetical protein
MKVKIWEYIRKLLLNKPPTVIFIICLICFICVLTYFVSYVNDNSNNIVDPEWRDFRQKISSFNFCLKHPFEFENTDRNEDSNTDENKYFKYCQTALLNNFILIYFTNLDSLIPMIQQLVLTFVAKNLICFGWDYSKAL